MSYATKVAASQPSANASNYGADVNGLLSRLSDNMKALDEVGKKQQTQDQALEQYERRFQNIEEGLKGHGQILNSLAATQECQGALMTSLNDKMDTLTNIVTGKATQDNLANEISQMTEDMHASNPSHDAQGVCHHE